MITALKAEELIKLGARVRTSYLLQQSGYTLGVARGDGEALTALLPEGYVDAVERQRDVVAASSQDRTVTAEESKELTRQQGEQVQSAKVWRRKVVNRAVRMRRMGHQVPDNLASVGSASSVPAITAQLTGMTATFEAHLETMGGESSRALLEEGKAVLAALSQVDADQETARFAGLPQKVRDYLQAKGTLYVGVKAINDAGRELHSGDANRAAAYNLRILHRRAPRRAGPAPGNDPLG